MSTIADTPPKPYELLMRVEPLATCRHGHVMLTDYNGCVTCVVEDNAQMVEALRAALTVQPRTVSAMCTVIRESLQSHHNRMNGIA